MSTLRIGAGVLMTAGALLLAVASAAESRASTAASATVVVYDQINFKGRTLTIAKATPDLAAHGFDNKVASLSIEGGSDWVLCEHKNYGGRCVRVQGKAGDLSLLQLNGRVSSLYPVPATPTPTPPAP